MIQLIKPVLALATLSFFVATLTAAAESDRLLGGTLEAHPLPDRDACFYAVCSLNAMCVLNSGDPLAYDCVCEEGWTGDGVDCVFDQCFFDYPCVPEDQGGYCEYGDPNMTPATYACGCRAGYLAGDTDEHGATSCVDFDECEHPGRCHEMADCTNTLGSYECTCILGWEGDGDTCTEVMTSIITPELGNDMDIRFNKITFDATTLPAAAHPLTLADYPLGESTFEWLRYSKAVSVSVEELCVGCDIPFSELIDVLGGLPNHPSADSSSEYWNELFHVVDIQYKRLENVDPMLIMPLPNLWKGKTIDEIAECVHDEYPGYHHTELIKIWNAAGLKMDNGILPFTCTVEFIRGIVAVAELVTWAFALVGPPNFGVKWYVGRARPEEVAWQIHQGQITSGPPAELRQLINNFPSFDLPTATAKSFTAYSEGSPAHPSWPAMHSAGSAGSLWMAVVMDLTEAEWCQVKITDYAISFARTVAGVHYVSDNIAGLTLGQEIVARRLPQFLHDKYGSDIAIVEAKVESKRFDWNTFLDTDCAKGAML